MCVYIYVCVFATINPVNVVILVLNLILFVYLEHIQ